MLTLFGDRGDMFNHFLTFRWTLLGDRWESSGDLGEFQGLSKIMFEKKSNDPLHICLTFRWSIRHPSGSHLASRLNMFEYSGTPGT